MARITDQTKIERLKLSTMKLVAERGFGGASATLIAKDAKVASGYFYMHYKGKYEMVNALLHDVYREVVVQFEQLAKEDTSFTETIENLVRHFMDIANSNPVKVKFLYVLTNDYSFVLDKEIRENIYSIIGQIKDLGHKSGTLDPLLTTEDLYLILFINTIQFINQRYKNSTKQVRFTKTDQDHLLYLINKILK